MSISSPLQSYRSWPKQAGVPWDAENGPKTKRCPSLTFGIVNEESIHSIYEHICLHWLFSITPMYANMVVPLVMSGDDFSLFSSPMLIFHPSDRNSAPLSTDEIHRFAQAIYSADNCCLLGILTLDGTRLTGLPICMPSTVPGIFSEQKMHNVTYQHHPKGG